MGHIAIQLDPVKLQNANADLRYLIPDIISESTSGRVIDGGCDYADDDVMTVFLECLNPVKDVVEVIDALRKNTICENNLLDTAIIGISDGSETFRIVHPGDAGDTFTVIDW